MNKYKSKVLAVIPSRIGSTRLSRKPLIKIAGKPLVQHVYEGTMQSRLVDKVIVATDSKEIFECVKSFNGEVMMTSNKHKNGTERVAEIAKKMPEYNIVINVQGDQPMIKGEMIDSIIKSLIETEVNMATLKTKIKNETELNDSSVVKVVTDKNNLALYFSRSTIPFNRDGVNIAYYNHLGIYGFTREFLLKYIQMEQTILEQTESLEQLRFLENGAEIYVAETKNQLIEVNVPEDISKVENTINNKIK
ncbi:MAG: 3-deoxy-manno-octulosonate cytidylyltransferase [Candidatus Woesearchaeota archaeon]